MPVMCTACFDATISCGRMRKPTGMVMHDQKIMTKKSTQKRDAQTVIHVQTAAQLQCFACRGGHEQPHRHVQPHHHPPPHSQQNGNRRHETQKRVSSPNPPLATSCGGCARFCACNSHTLGPFSVSDLVVDMSQASALASIWANLSATDQLRYPGLFSPLTQLASDLLKYSSRL